MVVQQPTQETVWNCTVTSVLCSLPLMYDTVMSTARGYLIGWEDRAPDVIYHYVTGDGFLDWDGARLVRYVDPNRASQWGLRAALDRA